MNESLLVIIGAGPAGMSAAIAAHDAGIKNIIILERDCRLGGILPQCIHNGFGLHKFGEELTGPEYTSRLADEVNARGIQFKLNTMVTEITLDKTVKATSGSEGVTEIKAGAIILAMGCRERARGALNIPGTRPSGVYTAGCAQKMVNIMGYMPGNKVVILGSGDIGLIMARRMTLEGAEVKAVCELLPYSGGLARNIEQCLHDFNIPLLLSHTVTKIHGEERLTGVTISEVDENRRSIDGTEQYIECDTLLLSCGLIPENELTISAGIPLNRSTGGAFVNDRRETETEGIFACGNVLHVHDLADYASDEGEIAGNSAAQYLLGEETKRKYIKINHDRNIRYTVPQKVSFGSGALLYFRTSRVIKNAVLRIREGDKVLLSQKKRSLAPAEMEKINLKPEMTTGGELTIEIIEGEQ